MYDRFFFKNGDAFVRYVMDYGPHMPTLKEYRGSKSPTLIGHMAKDLVMLVETEDVGDHCDFHAAHLLLRETRQACRKDFCRVTPFFKPKKDMHFRIRLRSMSTMSCSTIPVLFQIQRKN